MSSSTDITAAKIAIRETLYRYSLMVDGRRWDMIDEVFTDDAVIDYTSVGWGATRGAHREMLKWLDSMLEPWPMNQHLISNEIITIDGQSAKSTCCFNAPMGCRNEDGKTTFITNAGYYHDELVLGDHGWRIRERVCDMTIQIFH
jgi:3-phenylpropionate/cinnamic acid dioxygenase small subunit